MLAYRIGTVMVCSLLLTACTPKKFEPQTPDQQAVARTMETYLAAFRTRDFETLSTVLAPDATISYVNQGFPVTEKPFSEAMGQGFRGSRLPQGKPVKLKNFRQASPDSASIETFIVDYPGSVVRTTKIRWDLSRLAGEWRILRSVEETSITNLNARGGGP